MKNGKYWDSDFKNSLEITRNYRKHRKEVLIYPGKYKFRYFSFSNGMSYSPFAVRITNEKDSLLAHFSFADELYYLYNENRADWDERSNLIRVFKEDNSDSKRSKLLNLKSNLNELIISLGYQNDEKAIRNLIDVLFHDVLRMEYANLREVDYLYGLLSQLHTSDQSVIDCKNEFKKLSKDFYTGLYLFKAKEGNYGFWTFSINKNSNGYQVNVKFSGDLIYYSIYL